MPKAIVIGAGIAGIACAIRLAVKGYAVEVLEANTYPGGKLSEIHLNGYRFDAGPSLFTMPQYVDELFELAGKNPEDYFRYQKLDKICQYFWEDGTQLSAWSDTDKLAQEVEDKTDVTVDRFKSYLKKSSKIYDITHHIFLEKSLHKLYSYINFKTLKSIVRLPQIDVLRSMNQANESFFNDPKMVQFANRYATYNGSDPYQAPATLNVISHIEQYFGAYFPEGGMYSIVLSLVRLAEELGIKFHYASPVQEIIYSNKKITGVKVGGELIPADVVVSNMDIYFTYRKLLPSVQVPKKIHTQERSSSALIFYWGIKKTFQKLDLHNIFFSDDYKTEFDAIFKKKTIYHDPTVYVHISSKHCPIDAPEACENWFTMINVPNNSGQDWDLLINNARKHIIGKLSRMLHTDIRSLITCEDILDPRTIEVKTSSYQGSLYGTSSNSRLAAFLRHANYSSKIKNLYFAGGSVHPGGGIPLALLSAKITTELITGD